MVYQVERVGLNPLQLVLVGTVLEISVFIFEIPTGVVADVYSRRLSVIIGSLLIGFGFIVEGTLPIFAWVLVAQVLWGVGATFTSGAGDAWLADEIGEAAAGQAYLRGSQAGHVAGIIGIVLSVALASIHLQLAIIIGGGLHILTAVYLLVFMPEEGFTPKRKTDHATGGAMTQTMGDGIQMVRRRPVLLTILTAAVVYGAASESYDRLWTPHILHNFALPHIGDFEPVVWFGIIAMVSSFIGIFVTEFIRRRVETSSHESMARTLLRINTLIIILIAIFAMTESFGLALIAFWMIGPLRGLTGPLQTAWVNQGIDPNVRATLLSITAQADAIGQISGGPALGYIGNVFGVRSALALGSFLLTPTLILYERTLQKGNHQEKPVVVSKM